LTEKLALALSALHEAIEENKELKGVVEKLVQNQNSLLERSDRLEQQYSQMLELMQAS
jgi:hypothetical protein